jgi:ribonuclease-3
LRLFGDPIKNWCEKAIGYRFSNEELLHQALTHRSASGVHNERLEFLGDAVLGLVIAETLYQLKADAPEGVLSRYRSELVCGATLAEIALEIGIGPQLVMGSGEHRTGGHQRKSVLANAVEALFGAILLDSRFSVVAEIILGCYTDRLANLPAENELKDPKTRLQEYLQARQLLPPAYELAEVSGAAHAQTFIASCTISALELVTHGTGSSRRRAEQAAAAAAYEEIEHD